MESTNKVPESILTFPDMVCTVPFSVALLTVAFPDIVTSPLKSPELADSTNLPVELPSSIVFDDGDIAVVFAVKPEVLKLPAFTTPV